MINQNDEKKILMSHQQWLFFKYVELMKEKKDYPLQFFKHPPVAPRLYEPLSFLIFLTQNDTFPKMDNEHSFVSAPLFCLCLFSMICLLNLYDQFRQTTQWTKNPFDDFLLCCQISLLRLRINFFKPKQFIWTSNNFVLDMSLQKKWDKFRHRIDNLKSDAFGCDHWGSEILLYATIIQTSQNLA